MTAVPRPVRNSWKPHMTDDAFLQAIIGNPDDDTPRLVYADWLEEHGQPDRAAFIRVQCQLTLLPDDDPRRPELEARERRLLEEHGGEWAGPLRGQVEKWQFRRGFIESVTLPAGCFLERAETIIRAAPVQRVRLQGAVDAPDEMAACPSLGQLVSLGLWNGSLRERGLRQLLASPYLGRLRMLNLGSNDLHLAGVRALAESPLLAQLANLGLGANHLDDRAVEELAASPHLGRLESLNLHHNPLGLPAVRGTRPTKRCRRRWRRCWITSKTIGRS